MIRFALWVKYRWNVVRISYISIYEWDLSLISQPRQRSSQLMIYHYLCQPCSLAHISQLCFIDRLCWVVTSKRMFHFNNDLILTSTGFRADLETYLFTKLASPNLRTTFFQRVPFTNTSNWCACEGKAHDLRFLVPYGDMFITTRMWRITRQGAEVGTWSLAFLGTIVQQHQQGMQSSLQLHHSQIPLNSPNSQYCYSGGQMICQRLDLQVTRRKLDVSSRFNVSGEKWHGATQRGSEVLRTFGWFQLSPAHTRKPTFFAALTFSNLPSVFWNSLCDYCARIDKRSTTMSSYGLYWFLQVQFPHFLLSYHHHLACADPTCSLHPHRPSSLFSWAFFPNLVTIVIPIDLALHIRHQFRIGAHAPGEYYDRATVVSVYCLSRVCRTFNFVIWNRLHQNQSGRNWCRLIRMIGKSASVAC